MCGIAGHVKFNGRVSAVHGRAMMEAIRHRGPDDRGDYCNEGQRVFLGHQRLSFLDLTDAGRQPLGNDRGTLWITYNGEVYNYIELRQQLEKCGFTFRTNTDTEVIVKGYEYWGAEVLHKLKGMFAFAIWNEEKQELFLARDRFGIKPLYYYYEQGNFVFASEIKGIKAHPEVSTSLNLTAFADYFVYRYVPSPATIWNEVYKLQAAHYLLLKPDGTITQQQYWSIPFAENTLPDRQAVEQFDALLLNSVKTHARSEVPVGAFLSGGYDSSAIVCYLSRFGYTPSTFAIGFQDWDVSEHHYAEMVARQYHTSHHSLILETQSLDILDHLVWVYDEPIADISIIPTYLVSQEAAKHVKAVMSGEGSDEMLVGYQWQKDYVPEKQSWFRKWMGLPATTRPDYLLGYYAQAMAMGRFDRNELHALLHPDKHAYIRAEPEWYYRSLYDGTLPDLKAIQQLDVKHFMGELVLTKVDRASMANSLEIRVPFLDHEIYEFVFGLSASVYYKKEETKHLLYQNLKHYLPASILERKKQGFVGPDKYYMNIAWYQERLSGSRLVRDGIVNATYPAHLLQQRDHWRLWKLTVMELWYRKWC